MRRLLFVLPAAAVLLVTLAVGIPRDASAHGALDQENDPGGFVGFQQIQAFAPIGQEFKPTQPALVSVDVRIYVCNSSFGDDTITLRVRDATIGGTILAEASQVIENTFNFTEWVHYDVSATLVPGQTYVIELEAAAQPTHCWSGGSAGDQYADGRGIRNGTPEANRDFLFRTFSGVNFVGGIVELSTGAGASVSESAPSAGGDQAKVAALAAVGGGLAFLAAGGWFVRRRLLH